MLIRHLITVSVCLTFLSFAAASAAQDMECDSATDYLAEGETSLDAGDYEAAIAAFNCAVEAAPEDHVGYAGLVRANALSGNFVSALDTLSRARSAFGRSYPQAYGRMVADARETLETDPDDLSMYMLRSQVQWYGGIFESVLRDVERILERDPDNLYATTIRGSVNLYMGDDEAAQADFARALELSPDNPNITFIMAEAYIETGRLQEALDAIERTIELGLDLPVVYLIRADALAGLGNRDAAALDYHRHAEMVIDEVLEAEPLEPGQPATYPIAPGQAYHVPVELEEGQRVTVLTLSTPDVADSFLVLLAPDGTPVRGNDDSPSLNAAISNYDVPETGTYTLIVTTFNGYGMGEIEVRLAVEA